jgi:glycyl-tRNA synthetase alpha subunit
LKQLVQDHNAVYKDVKSRFKDHLDKGVRPTCQQILDALESVSGKFSKVFVVVDALDECSNETRAEFLIALQHLSRTISLLVIEVIEMRVE